MGSAASTPGKYAITKDDIESKVDAVLHHAVVEIANKNKCLRLRFENKIPSGDIWRPKKLTSTKSLRALALKHHSRQENTYIPQESLLHASKGMNSTKSGKSSSPNKLATKSSSGSLSAKGSFKKSPTGSNNSLLEGVVADFKDLKGPGNTQNGDGIRKKPNLKISIQDDLDWIQVCFYITKKSVSAWV